MKELNLNLKIKDFLYSCEFIEKKSINTVKSLKVDLFKFNEYILKNKNIKTIKEIDIYDFRDFLIELQNEKITKSSINRKISSLKTFFKYLKREEKIETNLAQLISSLNYEKNRPDIIDKEEMNALRNAIEIKNYQDLRDKLIIELLYSTGITSQELLGLGEEVFDLEKREVRVRSFNKSRVVYFSKRTKEAFEEYVKEKKIKLVTKYRKDILFINSSGNRLSDRSLRRIIEKYRVKAKINKEITPHTFRHSFTTYMLENKMSVEELQILLGYSNITSMKLYLDTLNKK